MQVTNTTDERVYVPLVGDWVEPGDAIDVDETAAASLVEQGGWAPPADTSRAELAEMAAELGIEVRKS